MIYVGMDWAAWYNTWLLIKLTTKGVVFSFLCRHGASSRSLLNTDDA